MDGTDMINGTERQERGRETLVDIRDLWVEYRIDGGVVHAVNGVDLTIHKGETLGLVGETGAGKTSIAKSILRVLPDPPSKITAGQIFMDGEDLLQLLEHKMRRIRGKKISMIFQDPMTALNPTVKVGAQIAEAIRLHEKMNKSEAAVRAVEMLEMVGITKERYTDYPHQFSGGMKQRVVIAMAMACHPELLLADEPTTALDVTVQAQILDMMTNLKKELQTSVLMITHDLGIVAETCDTVAVVYAGEIVEYGTMMEIFDEPSHPYTIGLFGSLPSIDRKDKRLKPIHGLMPDPMNLPSGCKFHPRCPYATEECRNTVPRMEQMGGSHIVKCLKAREKK